MSHRFSNQNDPTDFESEVIFSFLINESLSSWNFMYKGRYAKMKVLCLSGVKYQIADYNFSKSEKSNSPGGVSKDFTTDYDVHLISPCIF